MNIFHDKRKANMKRKCACLLLLCVSLCSWAHAENTWPEESRPGPKATQRKRFDCSFGEAFSAVIDLFQEQGFLIEYSDIRNGLIVVSGNANDMKHASNFWVPNKSKTNKNSHLTGTVEVKEIFHNVTQIKVLFTKETDDTIVSSENVSFSYNLSVGHDFNHNSRNESGYNNNLEKSRVDFSTGKEVQMENKTEFINDSAIYLDFFKKLEKIISNRRDLQ